MRRFYTLLLFFQKRGYYVCQRIADRLGIRAKVVRTTFMYLTFVTLGFGFALYLFLAFWMDPERMGCTGSGGPFTACAKMLQ